MSELARFVWSWIFDRRFRYIPARAWRLLDWTNRPTIGGHRRVIRFRIGLFVGIRRHGRRSRLAYFSLRRRGHLWLHYLLS